MILIRQDAVSMGGTVTTTTDVMFGPNNVAATASLTGYIQFNDGDCFCGFARMTFANGAITNFATDAPFAATPFAFGSNVNSVRFLTGINASGGSFLLGDFGHVVTTCLVFFNMN